MNLDFFVLAGGGGGGAPASWRGTGGGGAGGLQIGSGAFPPSTTYDVVVGAGGAPGAKGGDSAIFGITGWSVGGGFGGPPDEGGANGVGGTGGSGGGASPNVGGQGPGAGTPGQGFNGGNALVGGNFGEGGGGGGAAGVGVDGAEPGGIPLAGNGGAGTTSAFSGVSKPYAGGGGGGGGRFGGGGTGGSGGSGGGVTGGNGGSGSNTPGGLQGPSAGKPNTGGGGGGGTETIAGAAGGSGIVMIRYATPTLGAVVATGGTVADIAGGYRLHTFLSSANFTIVAPTISSLSIASGLQGTTIAGVVLNGANFTTGSTVAFGGGLTVANVVVGASTWISFDLTIPATAPVGGVSVVVTNQAGASAPGNFVVVSGAPTIATLTPTDFLQGTSTPITITGTNFRAGATITVSGGGLTVSNVAVVNATTITGTMNVPPAAPTGAYALHVNTDIGASADVSFNVKGGGSGFFIVTP